MSQDAPKNNGNHELSTPFSPLSKDYSVLMTSDGSPSLRFQGGEAMHSLEGALSETLYIYGPVIDGVLDADLPPRFLSLGLGAGYVEVLIVAKALRAQKNTSRLLICSYESDPHLVSTLKNHILEEEISPLHQTIIEQIAKALEISLGELNTQLKKLIQGEQWQFCGPMSLSSEAPDQGFSGIFFDAFSSKTSPDLWSPDFLDFFLGSFCAPMCYLSTYAVTGHLKRSLENSGFDVEKKKGFGKKRESLWALRTSTPQK